MDNEKLAAAAAGAMKSAYAPYSNYFVGAALETEDGRIFTGCNIENATYTPTVCAERTAFFKAVSEGVRSFRKIAIVGGTKGDIKGFAPPCGVCRQVMREFCDPETFEIILFDGEKVVSYLLKELLPMSFDREDLSR